MTSHDVHNQGVDSSNQGSTDHGDHDHVAPGHAGHGDKPDVHGMLVVGEETVFLSHLPMFDHPHHDYQVILEVTFAKPGGDPHVLYVNDRKTHRETKIYTLVPERFVLPDLVSTDPERPPLHSFRGTIFRGHFERGGMPIMEDVEVQVTKVVHFRRFEPLGYLLFGNGHELFLAHLITKPPDFDQVLSVKVVGHEFTDEEMQRGVRVTFPGRVNTISQRLMPSEKVVGEIQIAGEQGPESVEIQLEVGVEFYFEEGELRSPAVFAPTVAEQSAGF